MRYALILAACLCAAEEQLPNGNPAVQSQLKKTYDAMHRLGVISSQTVVGEAHIMRQNPVLLKDHALRQLAEDENALVSEAAKPGRGQ